jgi:predicted DNA-binding protein
MAKPTTIRIPEDLLNEINQFIEDSKLDRAAYLREVIQKGFAADKQDRLLAKYSRGELSHLEVCRELRWNPWELFAKLKERGLHLSVSLEDWMDASQLD